MMERHQVGIGPGQRRVADIYSCSAFDANNLSVFGDRIPTVGVSDLMLRLELEIIRSSGLEVAQF